jgi:hypothetical protein
MNQIAQQIDKQIHDIAHHAAHREQWVAGVCETLSQKMAAYLDDKWQTDMPIGAELKTFGLNYRPAAEKMFDSTFAKGTLSPHSSQASAADTIFEYAERYFGATVQLKGFEVKKRRDAMQAKVASLVGYPKGEASVASSSAASLPLLTAQAALTEIDGRSGGRQFPAKKQK